MVRLGGEEDSKKRRITKARLASISFSAPAVCRLRLAPPLLGSAGTLNSPTFR